SPPPSRSRRPWAWTCRPSPAAWSRRRRCVPLPRASRGSRTGPTREREPPEAGLGLRGEPEKRLASRVGEGLARLAMTGLGLAQDGLKVRLRADGIQPWVTDQGRVAEEAALHDASEEPQGFVHLADVSEGAGQEVETFRVAEAGGQERSEEHTSELQSPD